MKNLKFALMLVLLPFTTYSNTQLNEASTALPTKDNFFYVGFEGGIVAPVKSEFLHDISNTTIRLKKSYMYTGQIGYSFYPGMYIEFSGTHQPKYKLGYTLPVNDLVPTKTLGNTKVVSNVYTVNLIYDLKSYKNFTPYVIFGAGIAQVKVHPTTSEYNGQTFFKILKTTKNCKLWQVGLGVSKEITPNLTLNLSGKLQVVHNVKINYQTFNPSTGQFINADPIKKTLGVAEYGIGFIYKLPF